MSGDSESGDHDPGRREADDREQVYVLHLWHETGPPPRYRVSLYHAPSGRRLHFSTLEALVGHLREQLGPDDALPEPPHLQS